MVHYNPLDEKFTSPQQIQDQEEHLLSTSPSNNDSLESETLLTAQAALSSSSFSSPSTRRQTWSWNMCLMIGLILCYIPALPFWVGVGMKIKSCADTTGTGLIPDIAQRVKYLEIQKFPRGFRGSPFAGPPSEELDQAWHGLFEYNDIRVELSDLQALNLESIPLQQGGYIAQPGVFHELHCLKRIRHWIYRGYYVYPKDPSDAELDEWEAHIHHCIERLRLASMCRGDTSLAVYKWLREGDEWVPTITDIGPHQCVKWENLNEWVKERSVNLSEPGLLVPKHGM